MGWFFGEIFNKKWFKGLQMRPYIKLYLQWRGSGINDCILVCAEFRVDKPFAVKEQIYNCWIIMTNSNNATIFYRNGCLVISSFMKIFSVAKI